MDVAKGEGLTLVLYLCSGGSRDAALPKLYLGYLILLSSKIRYKDKLDAETKVNKRFKNPRARDCSVSSKTKPLLRDQGLLNRLVTVG